MCALWQYEIPRLADAAYARVGHVIRQITSVQNGLRVLRELSDEKNAIGALQRTLIARLLSLLTDEDERAASPERKTRKRSRSNDADGSTANEADPAETEKQYPDVVRVPKRSERPKKPTDKVKE